MAANAAVQRPRYAAKTANIIYILLLLVSARRWRFPRSYLTHWCITILHSMASFLPHTDTPTLIIPAVFIGFIGTVGVFLPRDVQVPLCISIYINVQKG